MGTGTAIVITYIAAGFLFYLIGNSFKDFNLLSFLGTTEDDNITQWANLGFRMIFYVVAIGFIMLAIGSVQDIVNADSNFNANKASINETISSSVVLAVRGQTYMYVILGYLLFLVILLSIFSLLKRKGDEVMRDYDDFGK